MSITRDKGFIVIECDHCHDTLETGTKNFQDALDKVGESDWITAKIIGEWRHFDSTACHRKFQEELGKKLRDRPLRK